MRVRRVITFTTRREECLRYEIAFEQEETDEYPSEADLLDVLLLEQFKADNEDATEVDTMWEGPEEIEPGSYKLTEELVPDTRSADEAYYDAHENEIREEMATGERDERGRRV